MLMLASMARSPRLSVAVPVHATRFADTLAAAAAAERVGLDGVFVPDHLLNVARPPAGVLECWTVLAALAARTTRVKLGTLVLATPFRHPPLLAKQAATLDAIAPGRIVLGLGAGGFTYAAACAQLGFTPLTPGARVAHVEETIACVRTLLGHDPADFAGTFARAEAARIYPRPGAAIPIIVAARQPRMLALAARAADGWNCPLPQELEAGLAALAAHGRQPETLEVSVYTIAVVGGTDADARRALARAGPAAQAFGDVEAHHLFGAPDRVRDRMADLVRRGADHIVLDIRGTPVPDALDLFAREVRPHLA